MISLHPGQGAEPQNAVFFFDSSYSILADEALDRSCLLPQKGQEFLAQEKTRQEESTEQRQEGIVLHNLHAADFGRMLLVSYAPPTAEQSASLPLSFKTLGAKIGKALNEWPVEAVDLVLPPELLQQPQMLEHFLVGLQLPSYRFERFKKPKESHKQPSRCSLWGTTEQKVGESITRATALTQSIALARDCGNAPGNAFTPDDFRAAAAQVATEVSLEFSYLSEEDMRKEGFGCFSAVTQGSDQPAFLNILEYKADQPYADTLLLVGKGLTFDSGGISLKPSASMEEMKFDMSGGAAVLGAMRYIGLIKPAVNVIGMIPSSENLINGKAVKPGDIVTAHNQKTVEILNTDAEGRLILCDSLSYGIERYSPQAVVDLATLTGACMVALGKYNSALFCNSEHLQKQLLQAGKNSGDKLWPLPLDAEYGKEMEGVYSDLVNMGSRYGGSITAAKFLENFVGETAWAHLDIAGTAWNVKDVPYYPSKGATGVGVSLLAEFIQNWQSLPTTPAK